MREEQVTKYREMVDQANAEHAQAVAELQAAGRRLGERIQAFMHGFNEGAAGTGVTLETLDAPETEVTPDVVLSGARLRKLRERSGLTQRELGDAIGYSSQAISAWESGRQPIPVGEIEPIIMALRDARAHEERLRRLLAEMDTWETLGEL